MYLLSCTPRRSARTRPGPRTAAWGELADRRRPSSYYGRHKAEVERRLDRFEAEAPEVRVVRMRPGLVFKKEAAEGIRRLFAGPFFPSARQPGPDQHHRT